ncbi:MAG: hypothetical protein ABL995_16325 [Bryobacteraceae bacterium]
MPVPHIPTPLEELRNRPFSFYPPIVNIEHNEWIFRRSDYDEVRVLNTKSQEELWIPRRFVSGVSSIEEPVVIVGLRKELEYKEGAVVPHIRRVIEMPHAVNDAPRVRYPSRHDGGELAPVVGIRLESEPSSPRRKGLFTLISAGILTCVLGLVVFRDATGARTRFFLSQRLVLPFTASDDYMSIVNRLGRPSWDRRTQGPVGDGTDFYQLGYSEKGYTLVLYGATRDGATYVGALNPNGRVVHSVKFFDGTDSTSLLKRMRKPQAGSN